MPTTNSKKVKSKSQEIKKLSPVAQVESFFKRTVWTIILDSLATIILGCLLVTWPDIIVQILAYLVGIFFLVKGLFLVANYFIAKGHRNFFNNDLLNGVIEALIGIALLFLGPNNISIIFRVVVGIWIVYGGLIRANLALKLNAAKAKDWAYILIIGLLMLVLGTVIIFIQGSVVLIIGYVMIACGIVGLIGDMLFISHLEDLKRKLAEKVKF